MRTLLAVLCAALSVSHVMADASDSAVRAAFEDAAAREPRLALGLAYAIGDQAPDILVSGPLHSRSEQRVASDAPWHIGSITKSFTATLILRLAERGQVELDAPIGSYLARFDGEMHADWRTTTLRQMLSHTAGLPANASTLQMLKSEAGTPTQGRIGILRALWDKPLRASPGTFVYSNIGYVLAGLVAEEVTGTSWDDLVTSEIAEPLGLTSLGVGPPNGPDAPWGHRSTFGVKRPADPDGWLAADNPAWMGPAGRLHMSLADLIAWGQAHLGACEGGGPDDFLTPESCRTLQTAVADDYGLGWVVQVPEGGDTPTIWHNGSNTMWYAVLVLSPAHDLVLAITLNSYDAARIDDLAAEILSLLIDPGPAPEES